ncbi:hypothetical protein LP419_08300 [Massilia sp. H-1]|nr:hypothetical protein LP419_08300 [Massilia sp. H-1]
MTLPFARRLAAFLFGAAALAAHAEAPFSFATTPGKLPKDVVPVEYAVLLTPDLAARTFYGSETVEIDVLAETSLIMLNAARPADRRGQPVRQGRLAAAPDAAARPRSADAVVPPRAAAGAGPLSAGPQVSRRDQPRGARHVPSRIQGGPGRQVHARDQYGAQRCAPPAAGLGRARPFAPPSS